MGSCPDASAVRANFPSRTRSLRILYFARLDGTSRLTDLPPVPCAYCYRRFQPGDNIVIYEMLLRGIILRTAVHEKCNDEAKDIIRKMGMKIPGDWK